MYSCHLFLIYSTSFRSLSSILYLIYCFIKYSLDISNFLEEISSLSHSVLFLYFFALIAEEGFLISLCCFLKLCIQMGTSFLFSFAFCFSSFTATCKASSDSHFALFAFLFHGDGLDPCLLYNISNLSPQFIRHSIYEI